MKVIYSHVNMIYAIHSLFNVTSTYKVYKDCHFVPNTGFHGDELNKWAILVDGIINYYFRLYKHQINKLMF